MVRSELLEMITVSWLCFLEDLASDRENPPPSNALVFARNST